MHGSFMDLALQEQMQPASEVGGTCNGEAVATFSGSAAAAWGTRQQGNFTNKLAGHRLAVSRAKELCEAAHAWASAEAARSIADVRLDIQLLRLQTAAREEPSENTMVGVAAEVAEVGTSCASKSWGDVAHQWDTACQGTEQRLQRRFTAELSRTSERRHRLAAWRADRSPRAGPTCGTRSPGIALPHDNIRLPCSLVSVGAADIGGSLVLAEAERRRSAQFQRILRWAERRSECCGSRAEQSV